MLKNQQNMSKIKSKLKAIGTLSPGILLAQVIPKLGKTISLAYKGWRLHLSLFGDGI
jgi:hypothetical protein